jgi:hypothetical protein
MSCDLVVDVPPALLIRALNTAIGRNNTILATARHLQQQR